MHRFVVTLIFICFLFGVYGQTKRDTVYANLDRAQKAGNDTLINYWTHVLAYEFSTTQEYDSALKYYRQVAEASNVDQKLLAETFNAMGVIFAYRDYLDSSLYYYGKTKKIYQNLGDTSNYVHVVANLTALYKDQARYQDALDIAFEAIKILQPKGNTRELASIYNSVATVYKKLDEFDRALEFQKKALQIRKALGLNKPIGQSYNNIGETFIRLGLYDSAFNNLSRSLVIKRNAGDQKALPATLNNLGLALLELRRYAEAEKALLEAIAIKEAHEDRAGLVQSLTYLARLNLEQRQPGDAYRYVIQGESLARDIGSLDLLAEILDMKIQILTGRKDFASALKHAQELLLIQDSLFNVEKVDAMFSIQARYESEQKEQEIELLNERDRAAQLNLQAQQRWITSLVTGVILLTVIVILVFLLFRATRKGKDRAELLLQEMHHRMKNNLQILSGILSLQSQELKDEKALEAVKESESRVHAMALIHKKLYNTKQHRTIQMHDYISELLNYLRHSYGFAGRQLELKLNLEPIDLDVDKAIPLGLILNEIILNAFKHAFIDHSDPMLSVSMTRQKTNRLTIVIEDNGKGNITTEKSNSFGVKMINLLTRDLSGTMSTQALNGTSIHLTIPL